MNFSFDNQKSTKPNYETIKLSKSCSSNCWNYDSSQKSVRRSLCLSNRSFTERRKILGQLSTSIYGANINVSNYWRCHFYLFRCFNTSKEPIPKRISNHFLQLLNQSSMKKIIWLSITIFTTIVDIQCYAQGIKGLIKDSNNEAIPNATIIVEKMSTGTVANSNGEYKLSLPSGKFTILFEALGYQSISKEVEVSEDFVILDIILLDRVFQLNEVVINNG